MIHNLKKTILIWSFGLFFFPNLFSQAIIISKPNPDLQYQTIEGWGTSLCWWAHMAGQWENEAKIDEIIDLITSTDHLNMNIFRYNIGGGDHPGHYSRQDKPGHMAKGKGIRAEMEGFKVSEGAPYNWDADAGQRKIMLKLREKRPDIVLEAFSNSAPYWMTYSGCSSGNTPASADNLKPTYYEAFCNYLLDVCQFYKDSFNITFKTLEPFNEPLTSYWKNLGGQEGCHFDVSSQIDLLRILYPKLKASGLNTILSASDETDLAGFIKTMEGYLEEKDIPGILGQVNTHTYDGSNEERKIARSLADRIGLPLWQSESGPIKIPGRGLASNLGLTQRLFDDLKYLRTPAWLDWQVLEVRSNSWGLLNSHTMDENFVIMKNFYVRMQVTRFIKQGYAIVDSGDDRVLTAISPDGHELVMVILNQSEDEKHFKTDFSLFSHVSKHIVMYRTSQNEDCNLLNKTPTISKNMLNYIAPGQSITTALIRLKK